jgi:hypothetical protein
MIEQMPNGLLWDQTRVSVVKLQRLVGEIPVVVVLHDRTNATWTAVGSNPGLCSENTETGWSNTCSSSAT